MRKKTLSKLKPTPPLPERQDAGTNTFSTRLNNTQKALVEQAAELKNWTPANLIRVAAIEKAISLNETNPDLFAWIATVLESAGLNEKARVARMKAQSLSGQKK